VRLPRILALQLKRFRYDYQTGQRRKVNTPMRFDTTLDMTPYLTPAAAEPSLIDGGEPAETGPAEAVPSDTSSPKATAKVVEEGEVPLPGERETDASGAPTGRALYELYAVLVHSGSASFGHYYALIKDMPSSEWYEFNDATVTPIKPSDVQRAFGSSSSSSQSASWSSFSSSSSAYMLLYRALGDPPEVAEAAGGGGGDVPAAGQPLPHIGAMDVAGEGAGTGQAPAGGLAHGTKRLRLPEPHRSSATSASATSAASDSPKMSETEASAMDCDPTDQAGWTTARPNDLGSCAEADDNDGESSSVNPYFF
jgi:hypothetical protein